MPRDGFLADNSQRNYPFIVGKPLQFLASGQPVTLPDAAIVDFRAVAYPAARWQTGTRVELAWIERAGPHVRLAFRCDAPGLAGVELIFLRHANDAEFTTQTLLVTRDLPAAVIAASGGQALPDPLWEATLTTGDCAALYRALPDGPRAYPVATWQAEIEPALCVNLGDSFVASLNVANAPRQVAGPPEGCGPAPVAGDTLVIVATCLRGEVALVEGYNAVIRQGTRGNNLTIGAAVGAGQGEPCGEVPLYPGEPTGAGSDYLSGGPGCGDVVSSINGVSASVIRWTSEAGIRVEAARDARHTLVVTVDPSVLARC